MNDADKPFFRLMVGPGDSLPAHVDPSAREREWFAPGFYHCLPLSMANMLGWTLHNKVGFTARWNGADSATGLDITQPEGAKWAVSYFGYGIITVWPRIFIETSPGVNTLIKAVPNYFKDAVVPMEGLIETDWMRSSFTLNLKITRPGVDIAFEQGEPLVQLVPYPRHFIESFDAQIVTEGERHAAFFDHETRWAQQRSDNLKAARQPLDARDFLYMRGVTLDGAAFPDHQKSVAVPRFRVTSA